MRTCRRCKKDLKDTFFTGALKTCDLCRKKDKKFRDETKEQIVENKDYFSEEQQAVINTIVKKENVVVNAMAGTGKTTTGIEAAIQFYNTHNLGVLYITFNKTLNEENRRRIKEKQYDSVIFAHNYHSCAMKWFHNKFFGSNFDDIIHKALQLDISSKCDQALFPIGLLVVDEIQDMTFHYKKFIVHLIESLEKKFGESPILLLMGDPFQCVYQFKGATIEYITNPKNTFKNRDFVRLPLRTSWRLPLCVAEWINKNLSPLKIQEHRPDWWAKSNGFFTNGQMLMDAWGPGIRGNPHKTYGSVIIKRTVDQDFLNMYTSQPYEDTVMLNLSVKNPSIKNITNSLDKEPWYIDDSQDDTKNSNPEYAKNKHLVTTINKFKGLERKFVVFAGFGELLEKYEDGDPLSIYNKCYVACTRTTDILILYMMGKDYLTMREKYSSPIKGPFIKPKRATELVEYVPYDDILDDPTLFTKQENQNDIKFLETIPTVPWCSKIFSVEGAEEYKNTIECIANYISIAVNFTVEFEIHPDSETKFLYEVFQRFLSENNTRNLCKDLKLWIEENSMVQFNKLNWTQKILYAIAYEAIHTEFFYIWRQLKHINLTDEQNKVCDQLVINTKKILEYLNTKKEEISVEQAIGAQVPAESKMHEKCHKIRGNIDFLIGDTIIESKITEKEDQAHFLQAQIYASMRGKNSKTILIYPHVPKIIRFSLRNYKPVMFILRSLWRKLFITIDNDEFKNDYEKAMKTLTEKKK